MTRGQFSPGTGLVVQRALESAYPADASIILFELPHDEAFLMRERPAAYRASVLRLFEQCLDQAMAEIVSEHAPHPRASEFPAPERIRV